ncbi:MAG: GGDEF domain-containing protein [Lachnospiraceae bacterium]|nr:GGDEF domain-containing protein [Lachnospiraceae bacterium]
MYAILKEFFQINFIPICAILFLFVTLRLNDAYEKDVSRLFYPVLASVFVLLIIDNMDYVLSDSGNSGVLHIAVNFVGYNLRIWILVRLMEIAMRNRKVYRTNFLGDWRKVILHIPAIIAFFITVTAFFTQWIYWFDEEGTFNRGPLSYAPHVVCGIYAIIIIAYAIYIWAKKRRMAEAVILILTTVFASVATGIETIFWLRGVLVSFIALATVFYYLCIHTEYFRYDILTGAFNRTNFSTDIKKIKRKGECAVISIDLNDLKAINDNKGHLAGDEALKKTAEIIASVITDKCTLYRVGGDEFAVLAMNTEKEDVEDMIAKMRELMNETDYSFAIGYSMWYREERFNEAYERADKEMYKNKAEIKGGANKIR